ncbi:hypothetical protein NEPAR06_2119 [Nematocida parisii]|uniref:Uncharacterized protein n=1 Tax=Nematocida parisii (strain ERTm3) TaxID=935791 RepID=I3EK17_NEMP3|nr:uncharacterized protein NEPG_00906 [Nematocida parisii ERTm1]EIJ89564.1 hypothetical protein NEQG_00334 [Nematocida parisii ERTm3]KAI5127532.1 hypothetical protein NEPAR03_0978 [Nematocida parisii]EIJ94239.1 hypothetical protein NEPG_00906 [Nematocida parisii ERTm1]KAI5129497.1 hypothetical protein NEPAR08_1647 [Nematocida parisii]KAI5142667.1 hypothetical protein NEPAR04_1590 [Nematocida parisii]|eukprot:XP_013058735.1 hypothetical protein NEPG_00906 [Nematocida parisii ERTm1]
MLLIVFTGVLALFLTVLFSKKVIQRKNAVCLSVKRPKWVFIINMYGCVPKETIEKLGKTHDIKLTVQETDQDTFQSNHAKFCKMIGESKTKVPYNEIVEFISKNKSVFPDIVILCSDTTVFKTNSPFLLYSAEVLHFRKNFSSDVLESALNHYSLCEVRNGK